MPVMLDVLGQRLEFGLLQQLPEGTLTIPIRSEVLSVVFAKVFDLRSGMLVIDLTILVTGTTVEAWILRGLAHVGSFAAEAGL
jgi:hypothetical protein